MKSKRLLSCGLVLIAGLLIPHAGHSQSTPVTSWTGTTSTDWGTASNWNNGLPGADALALIDNGHGPVISSTINGTAARLVEVGSAYGNGTLTIVDGGFLRVGGSGTDGGTVTLGLAISSTGTLRLGGGILETGGIHKGSGDAIVILNGGAIRPTASSTNFFRDFGDLTLDGTGLAPGASALTFEVGSGLTVIATNNFHFTDSDAGAPSTALVKTGAGILRLTGDNNACAGAVNIAAGVLQLGGSASLFNGPLNGASTAKLTLDVLAGANLSTFFTDAQAAGNFAGVLRLEKNSTLSFSAMNDATAKILARSSLELGSSAGAVITVDTSGTIGGLITGNGNTITVSAGQTLTLAAYGTDTKNATIAIGTAVNASLVKEGPYIQNTGAINLTGTIVVNGGRLVSSGGAQATVGGVFVNDGAFFQAASLGGNLTVGAGATANINGNFGSAAAGGSGTAVNNGGAITVTGEMRQNLYNHAGTAMVVNLLRDIHNDAGATVGISGTCANVDNAGLLLLLNHADGRAFATGSLRNTGTLRYSVNKPVTVATLSGGGVIEMYANLTTGAASRLVVTGSATGAHTVSLYNPSGVAPASPGTLALELISIADGDATFTSGNSLDYGWDRYSLHQGSPGHPLMPDPKKWYVGRDGLSRAAGAILGTAGVMGVDWHFSLDTLRHRMGELRATWQEQRTGPASAKAGLAPFANGRGDTWLRASAYRLDSNNEAGTDSFVQNTYGVTAGIDRVFAISGRSLLFAGAFMGLGGSDRDFDHHGDGTTKNIGFGVYSTWLHADGWFADLAARVDNYDNSFTALSDSGQSTRATYGTAARGLSLEAGRRFSVGKRGRLWHEPSVQAAVAWIDGASYTAVNDDGDIDVRMDDSRVWQYRAQWRSGLSLGRWQPHAKAGMVRSDTTGGAVHATGRSLHPSLAGWRFETGAGVSAAVGRRAQVYLDYEYTKADQYARPWSLNLGYRRAW